MEKSPDQVGPIKISRDISEHKRREKLIATRPCVSSADDPAEFDRSLVPTSSPREELRCASIICVAFSDWHSDRCPFASVMFDPGSNTLFNGKNAPFFIGDGTTGIWNDRVVGSVDFQNRDRVSRMEELK